MLLCVHVVVLARGTHSLRDTALVGTGVRAYDTWMACPTKPERPFRSQPTWAAWVAGAVVVEGGQEMGLDESRGGIGPGAEWGHFVVANVHLCGVCGRNTNMCAVAIPTTRGRWYRSSGAIQASRRAIHVTLGCASTVHSWRRDGGWRFTRSGWIHSSTR